MPDDTLIPNFHEAIIAGENASLVKHCHVLVAITQKALVLLGEAPAASEVFFEEGFLFTRKCIRNVFKNELRMLQNSGNDKSVVEI